MEHRIPGELIPLLQAV